MSRVQQCTSSDHIWLHYNINVTNTHCVTIYYINVTDTLYVTRTNTCVRNTTGIHIQILVKKHKLTKPIFQPSGCEWIAHAPTRTHIYTYKHNTPLLGWRCIKSKASCLGSRFPPSFIHQVIIITGLNKLCLYVLALKMASDADRA